MEGPRPSDSTKDPPLVDSEFEAKDFKAKDSNNTNQPELQGKGQRQVGLKIYESNHHSIRQIHTVGHVLMSTSTILIKLSYKPINL